MKILILDLYPAYIPFIVQCTKAAGDIVDPTVDNLIIYEEGGADATFDATTITSSPFNPAIVNAKTGLWGVLVDKTELTAGKFYIALWEMTVDAITTAKVERYFACNASQFMATGFATPTNITAGTITTVTNLTNAPTAGDFTATMKTSINTEVADVINTDAATELAAIPTTTGTLRQMVQFLFQYFRNKRTVDATTETMFKEDASTALGTAALTDDGSIFTKGEAN